MIHAKIIDIFNALQAINEILKRKIRIKK